MMYVSTVMRVFKDPECVCWCLTLCVLVQLNVLFSLAQQTLCAFLSCGFASVGVVTFPIVFILSTSIYRFSKLLKEF